MNQNYEKFKKTQRADVKLQIALEEYLQIEKTDDACQQIVEYKKYLQQRRRAAWEVLIREENLKGLQVFVKENWLEPENIKHCINVASQMKKKESLLWLLDYQWKLKNPKKEQQKQNVSKPSSIKIQTVCEEIKHILMCKLQNEIPALGAAFPYLKWKTDNRELWSWGVDSTSAYYNETYLITLTEQGFVHLIRMYLHSVFHCLYLHMVLPQMSNEKDKENWNLACDLLVEWTIDQSNWFPLPRNQQKDRDAIYCEIEKLGYGRDTKSCLDFVKQSDDLKKKTIKELFEKDQHEYWYITKHISREDRLEEGERLVNTWGRTRKNLAMQSGGEQLQKGMRSGAGRDFYQIKKKKVYDYRKFLRRFAITKEELMLDMESIDYIPYHYGLERYENVLLIEPLETTEVNRLEEFVIAIDTSGSCSGTIVKRFLEETYAILSTRENFFSKMKVHIIQCDSMIQDHKIITCEEDWKKYQEHVQIQGLGGTDFTPVFQLIDRMLEKKEIRRLKGIMYFTDGDGIFPRNKPAYETAFVFLNQTLEKQKIPDWAIRLNLDMKIE